MTSRVLTMAQVEVAPEHQPAYRAALGELAQRLAARQQRLWLFRSRSDANRFLEFTEGSDDGSHRARGAADPAEAVLEQRLTMLAHYDDGATALWDAVTLDSRSD